MQLNAIKCYSVKPFYACSRLFIAASKINANLKQKKPWAQRKAAPTVSKHQASEY